MHDYSTDLSIVRGFRRSLRTLEREVGLALERETDCCGVTAAQCHFLLETEDRSSSSLGELAEALSLDPSTLSRTADGLRGAGYVRRDQDPENRRKVSIALTDAGRSKVDSIHALCDASCRRLFAFIPAEKRAAVVESIGLLADAMRRKRAEEAGRRRADGGCA